MSDKPEWSRDAILSAIASEARQMMDDGYRISSGLRAALERLDWREWSDGDAPSAAREAQP